MDRRDKLNIFLYFNCFHFLYHSSIATKADGKHQHKHNFQLHTIKANAKIFEHFQEYPLHCAVHSNLSNSALWTKLIHKVQDFSRKYLTAANIANFNFSHSLRLIREVCKQGSSCVKS